VQSQSNELTMTNDSTKNGPFVVILIFPLKEKFEGFFFKRVVKNIRNSSNKLHD
jgi:hypothetical protein